MKSLKEKVKHEVTSQYGSYYEIGYKKNHANILNYDDVKQAVLDYKKCKLLAYYDSDSAKYKEIVTELNRKYGVDFNYLNDEQAYHLIFGDFEE